MPTSTNAQLLSRVAVGDQTAWNELVDRYMELIWRITSNYPLDDAAREDVVQTTWLRLFDHAASIHTPDYLGSWLCRVARNECTNLLRHRTRLKPVAAVWDSPATDDPIEDRNLDADSERAIVNDAWEQLSQACKDLLTLCMYDPPPTHAEIAQQLEMALGSVSVTRRRCLDKLRRHSGIAALTTHRGAGRHGE